MKLKSTVILATIVVTMGLLLGTSAAQEPTVIFEGGTTNAIGIENLEVNGILYNVEFTSLKTAAEVYGPYPGQFDTDALTVQTFADQVNSALTRAQATTVGAVGSGIQFCYLIAFRSGDVGISGAKAAVSIRTCNWATDLGPLWTYPDGFAATTASPYNDLAEVWATFTEAPGEPVDCRAGLSVCLGAADADREACIEESDTGADRRGCRREYRESRDECWAEFGECLAAGVPEQPSEPEQPPEAPEQPSVPPAQPGEPT